MNEPTDHITIRFTRKELWVLLLAAAGNVAEHPDAVDAVCKSGTEKNLLSRAYGKCMDAYHGRYSTPPQ